MSHTSSPGLCREAECLLVLFEQGERRLLLAGAAALMVGLGAATLLVSEEKGTRGKQKQADPWRVGAA